jgi:hypothetical protein
MVILLKVYTLILRVSGSASRSLLEFFVLYLVCTSWCHFMGNSVFLLSTYKSNVMHNYIFNLSVFFCINICLYLYV